MTTPPPLTEAELAELERLRVQALAALHRLLAELRDLRATPCPGCTCADSEHRYCPICADRIQDLEKRVAGLEESLSNIAEVMDWKANWMKPGWKPKTPP